jgi:DNA primase small subunit
MIEEHFPNIVFDSQEILTEPENWEKILAIIPDEGVQAQIRQEWEDSPNRASAQKWQDLKDIIGHEISEVRSSCSCLLLLSVLFVYDG